MTRPWLLALAACAGSRGAASPNIPQNTASATSRWTYRIYASGIESTEDRLTTWTLDERAKTADATVRMRSGRARQGKAWSDGEAMHFTLGVSHGRQLALTLSAGGVDVPYTCTAAELEVAPATATRASIGGEGGWKRGRWTVATRRLSAQVCRPAADPHDGPPELVLAPEPIEHVVADDNCCGESPSFRFVSADGAVYPPRDASFPGAR